MDNLRYIRRTMERAGSFTAVPGMGGVLMGSTALAAAWAAGPPPAAARWLAVWLVEAVVALAIGMAGAALKSRRASMPLLSGPGRKFVAGFAPAMLAGAVLTVVLFRAGVAALLPGVWLLLYGAAVVSGGWASVRVVPADGRVFHGGRRGGAAAAGPAGERPAGGRLRRLAHCVWNHHRGEIWRVNRNAARREREKKPQLPALAGRGGAPKLDRLIHERLRLGILSALSVNESLTFNELKKLLETTDGNLSVHARKLEEAGYVACPSRSRAACPAPSTA